MDRVEQTAVAWLYEKNGNRSLQEKRQEWNVGRGWTETPLYVNHTAAIAATCACRASMAAMRDAIRHAEAWLTAALECQHWHWDGDQREAATEARDNALAALGQGDG